MCVLYNFGKYVLGGDVCELNNIIYIEYFYDFKIMWDFIYCGIEVG